MLVEQPEQWLQGACHEPCQFQQSYSVRTWLCICHCEWLAHMGSSSRALHAPNSAASHCHCLKPWTAQGCQLSSAATATVPEGSIELCKGRDGGEAGPLLYREALRACNRQWQALVLLSEGLAQRIELAVVLRDEEGAAQILQHRQTTVAVGHTEFWPRLPTWTLSPQHTLQKRSLHRFS